MSTILTKRAGRAMVSYVAKRARYAPRNMMPPKYRVGMALGKFAWQNRRGIFKTARKIGKLARFRSKQRTSIAAPSTSSSRRQLTNQLKVTLASRILYVQDIFQNINQGFDPNDRDKDSIRLSGFKIWLNATNLRAFPVWFNMAIISPKETQTVTTTNFFRSVGVDRGYNFGIGLSSVEFHMRPINIDQHTVLAHRRMFLGENFTTTDNDTSQIMRSIYVPIKRLMRYESIIGLTLPIEKIFLVYWCDVNNTAQGGVSEANCMDLIWQSCAYFRNVKT